MIFADTSSGSKTIYLPSATTTAGREFIIQTISSANRITIQAYTGETVDGTSNILISGAGTTITLISNGTNFKSISAK
jgi:hypothetical protein